MQIEIRELRTDEIPTALALTWDVFSEYEAPVYGQTGTNEFRRALQNEDYLDGIAYFGAFDGGELVGVVGIRTEISHICFFFVRGDHHRQGIGTGLFRFMTERLPAGRITVNSSPYGLPFYRSLGFFAVDDEQNVNGIRFTPMRYMRVCERFKPSGFSFRRATMSDKAAVAKLYASVIGDGFCTWNEYYPTESDVVTDTQSGSLYLLFLEDELVGAGTIVLENEAPLQS